MSATAAHFRTLKQCDKTAYRSVPVPDGYLEAMKLVHAIQKRRHQVSVKTALLWTISRTMAWKHIKAVMALTGIEGEHATPKGLRHCFGVRMAQKTPNPQFIQKL